MASAGALLLSAWLATAGPPNPSLNAWGLAGEPAVWCDQPVYRDTTDVVCALEAAPDPDLVAALASLPKASAVMLAIGRNATTPVGAVDLRPLERLASLRILRVRARGSTRAVVELPSATALSELELDNVAVTGLVRTSDALRSLTLSDVAGFPLLATLTAATQLESLSLFAGASLEAEQLAALLAATNAKLAALTFGGRGLPSLAPLQRFRELRALTVSSVDLEPGADFRALAGLKLTHLDLSLTPFRDLGLLASSKDTLETLDLANTEIRSLAPLARFTRLRELDLQNSPADYGRVALSPLRRVTSLRRVSLMVDHWSRCRAPPEKDLSGVRPADCDTLRELEKRGVTLEYFGGC